MGASSVSAIPPTRRAVHGTSGQVATVRMLYASPVGASDRIYLVSRNGTTVVIEHSDSFRIMATNRLADTFSASPAIVGKSLYLRGEAHLYCIAEDGES